MNAKEVAYLVLYFVVLLNLSMPTFLMFVKPVNVLHIFSNSWPYFIFAFAIMIVGTIILEVMFRKQDYEEK